MGRQKKSIKKPGSQIPLKLKENEPDHIVDWFNAQGTIADSIRYLIEKDIDENGIRDVTDEIKQSFSYYKQGHKLGKVSSNPGNQYEVNETNVLNKRDSASATSAPLDDMHSKEYSVLTDVEQHDKQNSEKLSPAPSNNNQERLKEKMIEEGISEEPEDDLDIEDLNIFG